MVIPKYFIIIILVLSFKVNAQEFDTSKLILNSKMLLVDYLDCYESATFYKLFIDNYSPEIIFLKSKGFEKNFIFYKLHIESKTAYSHKSLTVENAISIERFFPILFSSDFIFSFDTLRHKIYKLSGFKSNDVDDFYFMIKSLNERDYPMNKFNYRTFLKNFYVEGLNWGNHK